MTDHDFNAEFGSSKQGNGVQNKPKVLSPLLLTIGSEAMDPFEKLLQGEGLIVAETGAGRKGIRFPAPSVKATLGQPLILLLELV